MDSNTESVMDMWGCSARANGSEPVRPSTVQNITTTMKPSRIFSSRRRLRTGNQEMAPARKVSPKATTKAGTAPSP